MCLECGNTDDNFVSYNSLKLNIKGSNTLSRALKAMFNETNSKPSFCKNCRAEQEKKKKISISNLPNILIIHLDRIHDNYEFGEKLVEKINDPLEFDFSLDLKEEKICSENDSIYEFREKAKSNRIYLRKDDYYKYDIQGIITYLGDAYQGDYYSFIRMENNLWIKIFDDNCEKFDEEMVKYLSFGTDSEGPNGYLLVYKRRKDYPVRILNFDIKEENKEPNNHYIKYKKETKDEVNKTYDISNQDIIDKNEINIKDYIFEDEDLKEIYSKISPKEIKTEVPKELFIQIIEENNKRFRKNEIEEYKKCERNFKLIILAAISSKDFCLFNNKDFSLEDIKNLLNFFNQQIFESKLNEAKSSSLIAKNLDLKNYINIFLDKLILPILNIEQKDEKIFELISIIGGIFLSKVNFEKILEYDYTKRIFDDETVKKFLNAILQIIENLIDKNNNLNFKEFFNSFFELSKKYTNNSLTLINNEQIQQNLFTFYGILYEIIHLDKNLFELPINDLVNILNETKFYEKRDVNGIIYEIISYLIEDNKKYKKLKRICQLFDEKLLKMIFNENSELLFEIILRIDYQDFEEKNKFFRLIIPFLFNYALKNNELKQLLDLLFKIINIKDEYTLERLYLLMGFPQIIIEKQSDVDDDNNNFTEENGEELEEFDPDDFWPKFGEYSDKYKTQEMFKYISNIKIYESHCILAQLFPCSQNSLYDNYNFIKNEQTLEEEEKKEYIYRLLSIALLNKGNYGLFKYIYLTQSRFIFKYKNLYEEMIDILSKDEKYDLTQIKNNSEICIEKINYELNKVLGIKNNIKEPQLPEEMKATNKIYKNIEEFAGFIPKQIPEKIVKALYSLVTPSNNYMILCIKYYTTYQNVDEKRLQNNSKTVTETIESIEEESDIPDIKDYLTYNLCNEDNDIVKNETNFLLNICDRFQSNKNNYIAIINEDEDSEDNKAIKLSVIRYIFFNNCDKETLFKETVIKKDERKNKYKHNYYISDFFNIGYTQSKNFGEIFGSYRKDYKINFVNDNKIDFDLSIINKNKISFPSESYFN